MRGSVVLAGAILESVALVGVPAQVNYYGGTKKVVGPVLARGHAYVALARSFPSDKTFARWRASEAFAVDSAIDNAPPDGENPDGTLPDSGGPAMLWLLLELSLVGGGSATVVYARRRPSPVLT